MAWAKIRPLFERLSLFLIVYPPTPVNRGVKKYVLRMSGSCESGYLVDSVLTHRGRVALGPSECAVSFHALKMDKHSRLHKGPGFALPLLWRLNEDGAAVRYFAFH